MVFISVSAASAQDPVSNTYDTLIQQYNLTEVKILPEGVTPIVIENPSQLAEMLTNFSNPVLTQTVPVGAPAIFNRQSVSSADRSCSVNTGLSWFQHDVTFYLNGRRITDAWSRPSLQGVTLGQSLTDTSTNWWHTNGVRTAATARAEGTVNIYLLIQGGIQLYSQRVGCSVSYP